MTAAEFVQKWDYRLRDNDVFLITPADLRELKDDMLIVFGLQGVNVPLYSATKTYSKDYLVRYLAAGQPEAFYYSLRDGKLPAPTGATDLNWKVVPGPVAAVALSQELTLVEAQGLEGSAVVAGRTYVIDFGADANGHTQFVTLLGTATNLFGLRGTLTVDGVRTNVRVNVASGVFGDETIDLTGLAHLGPDGRLKVGQAPGAGPGLKFNAIANQFEADDDALDFGFPHEFAENTRVNPTTGAYEAVPGWRTRECVYASPNVAYHATLPLFYAYFGNDRNGAFLKSWTTGGPTLDSTAPSASSTTLWLTISYPDADEGKIRIYPLANNTTLITRIAALEAQGGRYRGPHAGGTAYKAKDIVSQDGALYYANADFTSIALFEVSKWTFLPTGAGLLSGARTLWVCGGLASYSPQRSNPLRPYASLQAAHDAAQVGDIVRVLAGGTGTDALGRPYYTDNFVWGKEVRIILEPGVIWGGLFQCGNFLGSVGFQRELVGGEFIGRVILWRQQGVDTYLLVRNARFTGLGSFEVNGTGTFQDSVVGKATLRNCELNSQLPAGNWGPARLIARDDMGPVLLELDNTLIIAPTTACVTAQPNAAGSKVVLLGTTELRGNVLTESRVSVPSGTAYPATAWLVDQRPAGGSSTPPAPAVTIEQTLASNSTTSVPSVAAVKSALAGAAPRLRVARPAASNRFTAYNRAFSDGQELAHSYQYLFTPTDSFAGLQFKFGNWSLGDTDAGLPGEAYGQNAITIEVAFYNGDKFFSLSFAGQLSATIQPGYEVLSDRSPAPVLANVLCAMVVTVSVATLGQKWPLGTMCEAQQAGKTTGPNGGRAPGYGPFDVVGLPISTRRWVDTAVIGDSQIAGTSDAADQGWFARGMTRHGIPYRRFATGGARFDHYDNKASAFALAGVVGSERIICELGINSILRYANLEWAKTEFRAFWTKLKASGSEVWATTITPFNGFDADKQAIRNGLNTWIVAGGDGLLGGYLDPNVLAETAPASNVWKAGYSQDNLHAIDVGADALSYVITAAAFHV